MDVMSKLKEVGTLFRMSNYSAALERLHQLWDEIPDPKVNTPNSYLVIEYGVACSMKAGSLDEARDWAALAPDFAKKRQDRGEVEFLIGKVAFARGEIDAAKEKFLIANDKSRGKIFEGEDGRYAELIK